MQSSRAGWDHRVGGQQVLGDPPVVRAFFGLAAGAEDQVRRPSPCWRASAACRGTCNQWIELRRSAGRASTSGFGLAVQKAHVAGVQLAFQALHESSALDAPGHVARFRRNVHPLQIGDLRAKVPRPRYAHRMSPRSSHGYATTFTLCLKLTPAAHWACPHRPGGIELPAVVHAPQTLFLIATEKQRRAAMRAVLRDEPELPRCRGKRSASRPAA